MRPVTVVIAARRPASRAVCARVLQREKRIRVIGDVGLEIEAIAAAARLRPRILLLDFSVSLREAADLFSVLSERSPRTQIILLTHRASEARILDGLSLGARGYLERRAFRSFLPAAVRAVDAGEAWVPRRMVAKILGRLRRLTSQLRRAGSR